MQAQPAPGTPEPRLAAEAFAEALDRSDFAAARGRMAPDCTRERGGRAVRGADDVLESYAAAARWADRHFDEVRRETSIVAAEEGRFTLRRTEYLLKVPARWHRHRRDEEIALDEQGKIVRIVDHEVEGEPARLEAFLREIAVPNAP
jgi:hypothetical protein